MSEDTKPAVDTQQLGSQDVQPNDGGTPQDGGADKTYFLTVDDRTRYETQEDAVEGFRNAGQRIAELTPLSEALTEYAIKSPEELRYYLDRLIELEEKSAVAPAPAAQPPAKPEPSGGPQLSKEDQEAVAYIQKMAPHLGFPTREQIEEMKGTIESLKTEKTASEEQHVQSLIETGRDELRSMLESGGVVSKTTDAKQVARVQGNIETFIRSWMEGQSYNRKGEVIPGSPIDRFLRGGSAQRSAIEEGLKEWNETVGFVSTQKTKSNAATYQENKQNAMQKAVKPLTKPDAVGPNGQPRKLSREEQDADLDERAWQTFQANLPQ